MLTQAEPLLESGQLRDLSLLILDRQPDLWLDCSVTLQVENILNNPIPSEQKSAKSGLVGTREAREVLYTARKDARQFATFRY